MTGWLHEAKSDLGGLRRWPPDGCFPSVKSGTQNVKLLLPSSLICSSSLLYHIWASPIAQLVKNPPAMREAPSPTPGWEDPLEKETTTHSNILAWEIPWTEEPGGATVHGVAKSPT